MLQRRMRARRRIHRPFLGQTVTTPEGPWKKASMTPLIIVGFAALLMWALPGGILGVGRKR